MKTNAILFIGLVLLAQSGISGTLVISGTVPARGFTLDKINSNIRPNLGSELKVYVGTVPTGGRSPQSVQVDRKPYNLAEIQNWKVLTGPKALSAVNFVRVVAP